MRILVTGGAGFVGTNLIKRLLKEEHDVISVDNYSTGKKENEQNGCLYIDRDLSKNKWWNLSDICECEVSCDCQVEPVDLIFNIAALARIQPSLKNPTKAISNNFNSALNVLEWARKNNTPVVFSGSSTFHKGLWSSPYAWSKHSGEQLCKLYDKVYDLPTAICRFYNVYGEHQLEEGDYSTVIGIFEKQYREGKPLTITGDGEQRRDFTHIDDIVDGLIKCGIFLCFGDNTRGKTYELGRGKNYSINEIADAFGKNYPKKYITKRPAEQKETLNLDDKAKRFLGWDAKIDIIKYINKKYSLKNE